jgi:pimeloyl-ACP methyl ester carboxylesterase
MSTMSTKPPIVLVHGAWHGGWCWRRVVGPLRAAGHEVFAPTLTGLGDRAHLFRPDIGLDDHVADVVALLEAEELEDVVLVGHSYAGMVITGVAERCAERLRRLVYLDAFVPEDGQSLMSLAPPPPPGAAPPAPPAGNRVPSRTTAFFGVTDPDDARWVGRRVVDQPLLTMTQPVEAPGARAAALARSYIYCSSPATGTFDRFAARFRGDPAWRFHEMKCGHDAMVTDPAGLVKILLAEAAA